MKIKQELIIPVKIEPPDDTLVEEPENDFDCIEGNFIKLEVKPESCVHEPETLNKPSESSYHDFSCMGSVDTEPEFKIDVGPEFTTEYYVSKTEVFNDSLEVSNPPDQLIRSTKCKKTWNYSAEENKLCRKYSNIKLIYCTKCNETWEYSAKEGRLCRKCQSVVLHKCGKCKIDFKSLNALSAHLILCNKEPRFFCNRTRHKAKFELALPGPIQGKHLPRDTSFKEFNKCEKSYSPQICRKPHSEVRGVKKDFKSLPVPNSRHHRQHKTSEKSNLADHTLVKNSPRDPSLNRCSKCEKSFSHRIGLNRHSKICGRSKVFKSSYKHFSCNCCEYRTHYEKHLARHIRTKHLSRDSNLNKCRKCAKCFSQRAHLQVHYQVCGRSESFKRSFINLTCDYCQYKTYVKSHLAQHIHSKHIPRDPNSNKCSKCGKTFCWQRSLRRHLKKCGQPKDFKRITELKWLFCDHCQFKAVYKHNLISHILAKHLPWDPNLNCNKCGKNFPQRSNLKQHLKRCEQTKDSKLLMKLFICSNCQYRSKYKNIFARHTKHCHPKFESL